VSGGCHSFEVSYGGVRLDDTLLFLHGWLAVSRWCYAWCLVFGVVGDVAGWLMEMIMVAVWIVAVHNV
jgi:hypothetical protein